jgi:ATP-binding cassette subfamily B protein
MKALAHLNKYLWKYKYHLILGTVFIVASNIFAIYAPRMIREAFDLVKNALDAYSSGNVTDFSMEIPQTVQWAYQLMGKSLAKFQNLQSPEQLTEVIKELSLLLGVFFLIAALLKGLFLFFTRQTIIIMSRLIEFQLKNEIYDHYQNLSLAFYRRNNTGDLMNRISEDVSKVRMYLGPAIMYTINLVVLSTLALYAMLSVNVELTLYVLLPLPILSISIYYVSSLINKRSEKVSTQQAALSTYVQEAFSGIRVLKAYNRQKNSQEQFTEACNTYKTDALSLVKVEALFMPAIILLIGLSTIITIYVGGLKAISGEISLGNIAEFVIYVNMLTWPFASVGWVTSLVQQAAASQQRINNFLHTEPEIRNHKETPDIIEGELEFEKVNFTYPDSGIVALKNISFKVKKGETLAIIGRTGSGKSTIANLICRNFDPSRGLVKVDGKPLPQINLNSLRSNIGYVPQDVFLFSDSISENIGFGMDEEEPMTHIKIAAEQADVLDNINDFPDGFETLLGERGINLSGGQKQRVSIARALARKPKILIFDDCLSAVDTETEERILGSLKKVMGDSTVVLISHRVSTVKLADNILVMDEGEIIESGTHQSLLDRDGAYAHLYQQQLREDKKSEAV